MRPTHVWRRRLGEASYYEFWHVDAESRRLVQLTLRNAISGGSTVPIQALVQPVTDF